jgi:hypothetical protein
MDPGAVLARGPAVALVDDFAHRNAPGSRHRALWQDVEDLLAAGIDVISTVSVGHLDSLADVAAKTPRDRWSSPPALPAGGLPSRAGRPAESFDIARCRVGVPRRRGRAKIIPDGGATGAGSLAAPSDQQILADGSLAGTGGPVLAPRAGGL